MLQEGKSPKQTHTSLKWLGRDEWRFSHHPLGSALGMELIVQIVVLL